MNMAMTVRGKGQGKGKAPGTKSKSRSSILLLILEVVMLLITSSYYDNNHSSSQNDHAYVSSKYQQQRQMNAAILGRKTILTSPPKNVKRKFLHSVMKYTTNGVSTFNPLIVELEILKAWDVNPNPGPIASNNKKENKSELCPQISLPGNGLKLGQWNINNLTDTKLEQIQLLLTANHHEIDVLFLLETFLKPNKPDCVLQIPGYTFFRKDQQGLKKGSRILVYIADRLKVERITSLDENELETIWLQIHPYKSNRPILIGAVYRPPSSTAETDARLELNIEAAYLMNQKLHVLGDFNMNFFDPAYKKHGLAKAFRSLNLNQLVNEVIRPVSSTCLDHIYTTHPSFIADISVSNIGLSDHLPVFIRRKYSKKQKDQIHSIIEYHDLKDLNTDEL